METSKLPIFVAFWTNKGQLTAAGKAFGYLW